MLGNIGLPELLVILVIALLLFGTRLPAVGKSLGEGIKNFKKGLNNSEDDTDAKETNSASRNAGTDQSQRVLAEEAKVGRLNGTLDAKSSGKVVDVEHKDVHKS